MKYNVINLYLYVVYLQNITCYTLLAFLVTKDHGRELFIHVCVGFSYESAVADIRYKLWQVEG